MNVIANQINYGWIKEENFTINTTRMVDNNNVLTYLIHNEGKSVVAEKFLQKLTANESKSYLSYLNKLVDQFNNTYHHSIVKKLIMLIILF